MGDFQKIFGEKYAELNDEQKRAVDTIEGPVMVLAGPGTGKTQILALRIAKILKDTDMSPHNILCLTFTETGVVEMRERLLSIIGPAAYYVKIYTFHSFCNEVISQFPEKFAFTRDIEALSDVERIEILREIADELPVNSVLKPFGDNYFYVKDFQKAISDLKRENVSVSAYAQLMENLEKFVKKVHPQMEDFASIHGRSLKEDDVLNIFEFIKKEAGETDSARHFISLFEEYFGGDFDEKEQKKARTKLKNDVKNLFLKISRALPKQNQLNFVYQKYQEKLHARGRYDFDDMILFVVTRFKEDPELLAFYREQFQYILVDEYQDTNGAQNETVKLLGEFFESPNIFVVGDDKQSIYRFQGASLENILYFYRLFEKDVEVVKLKKNYRSSQLILDSATKLISYNSHSIDSYIPNISLNLEATKGFSNEKIIVCAFENEGVENYFLARKVKELIRKGVAPQEIAILFRNNYDVHDIVDLFLRLKVPFRLEAGEDILKDPLIQRLITLLKLIGNLSNSEALLKVLHFDFFGFDALDVVKIIYFAGSRRKDLFEVIGNPLLLGEIGVSQPERFSDFVIKMAGWQKDSVNKVFSEFFDTLLKESGLLDYVLKNSGNIFNNDNSFNGETTKVSGNLEALNRLNSLYDEIKKMNRGRHAMSLDDFLHYIAILQENKLKIEAEPLATEREAVRLMTAHKSKGLEFEYVFIVKCLDKKWGNLRERDRISLPYGIVQTDVSHSVAEQNEDERRLFYVAMTRAKKQLYISYSRTGEDGKAKSPAIFLSELGEEFCQKPDTSVIEDEAFDRLKTVFLEVPKIDRSPEYEAYVRGLLKHYVMSVTHLNNYLECPRAWYYQNLLKVPAAKNKNLALGTAVHEALKDLFMGFRKGDLPPRDFLLTQFERHLRRELLNEHDYKESLEYGKHHLEGYYEVRRESFVKNSMLEFNFSGHGVRVGKGISHEEIRDFAVSVPITGKLDKIEILDPVARTVNVVDYKTGNPDYKAEALGPGGEYRRQIAFYKLLCDLSPQFQYSMVSGEIDFVQRSKIDGDYKKFRMEIAREELEELKEIILRVWGEIRELQFLHRGCGECEWCR